MEEIFKKIIIPIREDLNFLAFFQVVEKDSVSQYSTKLSKTRKVKIRKLKLPFYKHIWYD